MTASPHTGRLRARLHGALVASAAALLAVGMLAPVAHAQENTGLITVVKYICETINDPTTCTESRDDSLDGYRVDFLVHPGENDDQPSVQTITVEIGENAAEEGAVGSGSEGRESGATELPLGMYTVCDQAVAYKAGADDVRLRVRPRPEETSGGSNQTSTGNCITVDIVPGNNVLKFVNARRIPDGATEAAVEESVLPGLALAAGLSLLGFGGLLLVGARRRRTAH